MFRKCLLLSVVMVMILGLFACEVAPPGRIAFGSNRDGNYEIYVMNADGTNQINLTNNAMNDTSPDWN